MRLLSPKPGVPVKLPKTLGQLGLALLSLPLAVPAAADPAPSPASQHAQWIVVGVPAANATTGTLTAFQRVGQQWKVVLGPTPAKVGELGVGAPADGVHRTPVGTFTFDQAFGRQPDPGTKMPYFQATDQDWWDEYAGSPTYNTHVRWIRQSLVNRREPLRLRSRLRLRRQRRGKPATDPGKGGWDFSPRDRWQSHLGMCGHRSRRDALCAELARPFRVPADHHRGRKPVAGPIETASVEPESILKQTPSC
jgi:hypothetical protein